jgi:putative DNA primase/helicase
VNGSVWGGPDYVRSHRGTDNALESICEMHNDACAVFDEISQADKNTIGESTYMMANGVGKSRAFSNADARETKTWTIMFLSTGEITLGEKVAENTFGPKQKGGQSVRVVDFFADAGKGMGVVEQLNRFGSSKELVKSLSHASRKYYGTPIRSYLSWFVANRDVADVIVSDTLKRFSNDVVPAGSDGQVYRVAVCAAGGELAIEAGVLPWNKGDAFAVCKRMFDGWILIRGTGSFEVAQGVAHVYKYLARYGKSRFEDRGETHQTIHERMGWFDETKEGYVYYIPTANWGDVCGDYSPDGVAKQLYDDGILQGSKTKGKKKTQLTKNFRPKGAPALKCRVLLLPLTEEDSATNAGMKYLGERGGDA